MSNYKKNELINANQPLVSVIMNCYNGEKYLLEAIESVYSQTYQNWEIVFWDNASTDNSAKVAKSFNHKLKYFSSKSLKPLYTARNLALDACQGDVIAFLDCDDLWVADKLERQIRQYQSGRKIVYGGFQIIDQDGALTNTVVDDGKHSGISLLSLFRRNTISIGSIILNAEIMQKYRFDPHYELMGDFDLWTRLASDYHIASVGGIVELSRRHENNASNTMSDLWIVERRYLYFKIIKNVNFKWIPVVILYAIFSELKGLVSLIRDIKTF